MLSPFKLLKISLPVATATTATIVTTSLVSFKKEDLEKQKDNKDRLLDSFELKAEEFKERTILYSEDGVENSIPLENEALKEKVLDKLKKGEDLSTLKDELPDVKEVEEFLSKIKDRFTDLIKKSKDLPEVDEQHLKLGGEPQLDSLAEDQESTPVDTNKQESLSSSSAPEPLTPIQNEEDRSGVLNNELVQVQEEQQLSDNSITQSESRSQGDADSNIAPNQDAIEEERNLQETATELVSQDVEQHSEVKEAGNSKNELQENDSLTTSQKDSNEEESDGDVTTSPSSKKQEISPEELQKLENLKEQMLEIANKLEALAI